MRTAVALTVAVLLAAAVPLTGQAEAGHRWVAVIPPEIGVPPLGPAGGFPARCAAGPVYNFYHEGLYSQAPAVHLGYAYRPYYRYTAYRVLPRTYACGRLLD